MIGHPIEHSRSPQMMNAAFAATGIDGVLRCRSPHRPARPRATVVATLRATRALRRQRHHAPHKLAVAALCDELTPEARAIGAVNCLQLGAKLVGHNTDAGGFADALAAASIGRRQRGHAVVLSAPAARRARSSHGLRSAGVACGRDRGRRPQRLQHGPQPTAWDHVGDAFARADLVVDCTPIALDTTSEPAFVDAPADLDRLRREAVVTTLVYLHHRRPLLLDRAAARGHRTLDGAGMLVHQGARAFTLWTGRPAPVDVMRRRRSPTRCAEAAK